MAIKTDPRVEVFYLVNREGLSSVFTSQVLVPISQHGDEIYMRLGVLTPLGHQLRPQWREKMNRVQSRAADEFGVEMTRLTAPPARWRQIWSDARVVRRWISQKRQGNAPIILHCRNVTMTDIALDVARELNDVRVVFDSRGAEVTEFLDGNNLEITEKSKWPKHLQAGYAELKRQQKRAVHDSDHVLCVSEAMRQTLIEADGLAPAKSSVVPCCPAVEVFHVSPEERQQTRQRLKLNDHLVVAYCGSMAWYQLPEESMRLFQLIHGSNPSARFLAITTQPDRMRAAMETAGVSDELATVLSVTPSEVPRYLAAADIGLLLREPTMVNHVASPVKFGEYMATGLPVILSPGIGDYSTAVHDRGLGCVVQLDHEDRELSEQVDSFIRSDDFQSRNTHKRCIDFARGHLNWSVHIPRITELYRSLTNELPLTRDHDSLSEQRLVG